VTRPGSSDEDRGTAALHALGALSAEEAAEFEARLASLPAALREEHASLRAVAQELALAAPSVAPRPAVRNRLMARVAQQEAHADDAPAGASSPRAPRDADAIGRGFTFVRGTEAPWARIADGVEVKLLALPTAGAGRALVVRMAAGGAIPVHEHQVAEHCYVLEGDLRVDDVALAAGDYHLAAAGSEHRSLTSEGGCLLLIIDAPPG
jgi:anti-sigma factor ChrR (cupin superfamily)